MADIVVIVALEKPLFLHTGDVPNDINNNPERFDAIVVPTVSNAQIPFDNKNTQHVWCDVIGNIFMIQKLGQLDPRITSSSTVTLNVAAKEAGLALFVRLHAI